MVEPYLWGPPDSPSSSTAHCRPSVGWCQPDPLVQPPPPPGNYKDANPPPPISDESSRRAPQGLVLFEMATGVHPFMRPSGDVDLTAVRSAEPAPGGRHRERGRASGRLVPGLAQGGMQTSPGERDCGLAWLLAWRQRGQGSMSWEPAPRVGAREGARSCSIQRAWIFNA